PRPISTQWNFYKIKIDNSNNGIITIQNTSTYNMILINTYAASIYTLDTTITVATSTALSFTASDTPQCQPSISVNFNANGGTSYTWDFGDSTSSTGANPSHTYISYGDFDVTLIGTGTNGCTDTLVKPAFIKIRKPVISFNGLPDNNCIPFTKNFEANI